MVSKFTRTLNCSRPRQCTSHKINQCGTYLLPQHLWSKGLWIFSLRSLGVTSRDPVSKLGRERGRKGIEGQRAGKLRDISDQGRVSTAFGGGGTRVTTSSDGQGVAANAGVYPCKGCCNELLCALRGLWPYRLLSSGIDNLYERALHIRKLLLTLPRSVLIVMRYLFAFLNQ